MTNVTNISHKILVQRYKDHCVVQGPFNLGLAAVARGMFYKVDFLAVDKDIAIISEVLLDDGNRIIIPHGNFKVCMKLEHNKKSVFSGVQR